MLIAIHNRKGSFSDRWIEHCEVNNVPYKLVNCYDSDIVNQLTDCDGLMWHLTHTDYRAQLFARQLILSLEKKGRKYSRIIILVGILMIKSDKKYLLESIGAPLAESYVFYTKKEVFDFINSTSYPKVFKLRGGAGSSNVVLVKSKYHAVKLVKRSFGKGFHLVNRIYGLKETINKLRKNPNIKTIILTLKVMVRFVFPKQKTSHLLQEQKGYAYFQEFIPNNEFDDRIVVIGKRAIAIRRFNRKNDFRASGSGIIEHDPALFNKESIKIAFDVTRKIGAKSLAFDFIYSKNKAPIIVEISYAFAQGVIYDSCTGYWDDNLNWHDDNVDPQRYIIEDFISSLAEDKVNKQIQ